MSQLHNRRNFIPASQRPHVGAYAAAVASLGTIACGDPVRLNASNEIVLAEVTDADLAGIACSPPSATGTVASGPDSPSVASAEILIYDDPDEIFTGRMNANTTKGTGDSIDFAGSTGRFELDADAASAEHFVLGAPHVVGETSSGQGALWQFVIRDHQLSETSA